MGGNVFQGSSPIKRENIKPTLRKFVNEFTRIFPGAKFYLEGMVTLGSAGKKDVSGDLDLALDEKSFKNLEDWDLDEKRVKELYNKFKAKARTASDKMIMRRAVMVAIAEELEDSDTDIIVDTKGTASGTIFCQFPQYSSSGEQTGERVQVDVNVGNLDWLKFSYYSDSYEGNVKGLHRTQLMLSLFAHKGFTFSHNYGVKNKETGEVVARTPEEAIDLLNRSYNFSLDGDILSNYFKLQKFLKDNLSEDELHEIWDRYLKILDSTRCDIPGDLENYWLDSQDRLDLSGKFLPASSKLYPFRNID